jgi:drug/metabolite transporter (DMT)-like permease
MNGLLGAIIGATGFGAANIVIKKSLSSLTIPQTLMMSTLSGLVCLLLLTLFTGSFTGLAFNLLLFCALLAGGEVILYLVLYKTFDVSNVTAATAVSGVYPLLSTLFTVLLLHEVITHNQLFFIFVLVVGAIITSIDWKGVIKDGFNKEDVVKGLGWIFATTLLHAAYFPLLGNFTSIGSWPLKLLIVKIFSAIFLFLFFYVYKKESVLPPTDRMPFTSLLGLLEVVGWAGFSWATSNTVGQTAILVTALNSSALVTAVLAYFFLNEKLSPFQYLGILLIVASLTGLSFI